MGSAGNPGVHARRQRLERGRPRPRPARAYLVISREVKLVTTERHFAALLFADPREKASRLPRC